MRKNFFLSLLLLMCGLFASNNIVQAQPAKQSTQQVTDEIFRLVNKHRESKGLKPLKMNDAIKKEAARHSANMASGRVSFGHDGFDGRSDRLTNSIKGSSGSAENVAYTTGGAARVVDNWLHSAGHKKNIEGNYTLTGIGMAKSPSGQVYYTQIFIKN